MGWTGRSMDVGRSSDRDRGRDEPGGRAVFPVITRQLGLTEKVADRALRIRSRIARRRGREAVSVRRAVGMLGTMRQAVQLWPAPGDEPGVGQKHQRRDETGADSRHRQTRGPGLRIATHRGNGARLREIHATGPRGCRQSRGESVANCRSRFRPLARRPETNDRSGVQSSRNVQDSLTPIRFSAHSDLSER